MIIDRLTAVDTDFADASQLMMTYEHMRREGFDAECMLVIRDVAEWCMNELEAIKQSLQK